MSHLNGFHVFPRDNICKDFTFMHNSVFEHSDTPLFALLACIILHINGKQFNCSVFAFVKFCSVYNLYVDRRTTNRTKVPTIVLT